MQFNALNGGVGSGIDIAGYESLQIAYHLTGPAKVGLVLNNADGSSKTVEVELGAANTDYEVVTIPLTDFSGMPLNDVSGIYFGVNGTQSSGSGLFWVDGIKALAP